MTSLALHLLLAVGVGAVFLLLPLGIGYFVRPKLPTAEKDAVYECGEPTIGSSYIQFDLRFYVVALLFIIFDVEVVFFFPWAVVFGTATQLSDPRISAHTQEMLTRKLVGHPPGAPSGGPAIEPELASTIALTGLCDILVFFGVLLVGFAYVWKRGDLDWVRAMVDRAREEHARPASSSSVPPRPREVQTVS